MKLPTMYERLNNKHMTQVEKIQRKTYQEIIKNIHVSDSMHLLSYSCGDGIWDYLSAISNPKIRKITATDIVPQPVRKSDEELIRSVVDWNFVQVKPDENLPFPDKSFDIVIHHDVIEHTAKPYLMLKEQYRVLREDGVLIVGTPNLFRPANLVKLISGKLVFPVKIGYYEEIGDYVHIQEFHEQHLKLLLEEVGFSITKIWHCYFGIFPLKLQFSEYPKSQLGKSLCHYILVEAKK